MGLNISYAETFGGITTGSAHKWSSFNPPRSEWSNYEAVDKSRRTTFMWHSMGDACPQCRSLNGRIYENQDIFNTTLWDPWWGDILNLETGQKLTHGGTGINCRCTCEVRIVYDIQELEPVMELKDLLEMLL